MSDLPVGFHVGDLYCFRYQSGDQEFFGYIPGAPRVEMRDGEIKASLMTSPLAAVLSIQAVWLATAEAIEAAENEIRKRFPDAADVSPSIAELSDTTGSLTVTGANGASHTFGPTPTSGSGSYRVVFSQTLTSAEKPAAISALRGGAGCLSLTFEGTLELNVTATVEMSGDLADEVKFLAPRKPEKSVGFFSRKKDPDPPAPPDLAACAAGIDRAIAAGKLKMSRFREPNVAEEIWRKVETTLLKTAAAMLHDKIVEMGENAMYLSSFAIQKAASESELLTWHVSRSADPGTWFAQHGGGRLITDTGVAIPEPQG